MAAPRDHGGGLDAAVALYGGRREEWIDLSTGINPSPYPVTMLPGQTWAALPDTGARERLIRAARSFWNVPDRAAVVPVPGASAAIARMPALAPEGAAHIPGPTYNEHAAAFAAHGVATDGGPQSPVQVRVHPNNPDGRVWEAEEIGGRMAVIDESFCDCVPELSHIGSTARPGTVVLKSFGKFWGLAGLRLGFAIGAAETLEPVSRPGLTELIGPWAVSGPALEIGAQALEDHAWAEATRARLAAGAARLDDLMEAAGARPLGGTTLFRLYDTGDAAAWQAYLARHRIWSRVFPYSRTWLRLGLPAPELWDRVEAAF